MHVYRSPKILILENRIIVATDVTIQLSRLGYEVIGITTKFEDSFKAIASNRPDLILMNSEMQDQTNGLKHTHSIAFAMKVPIVFMGISMSKMNSKEFSDCHAYGLIVNMLDKRHLQEGIESALDRMREEGLWEWPKEVLPKDYSLQTRVSL